MIVSASDAYNQTIAKGGAPMGIFTGSRVEVVRNNNSHGDDITRPRGYRRLFHAGRTMIRPGAHDPHVTRVGVAKQAPSTVGTTMVIGGMDALKDRNVRFGVAGSRAPYAKHAPRRAGLALGAYVSIPNTPAMDVIRTAFARTGHVELYSKFTAPRGMVPNGAREFDPIPPYTRVPLGAIVPGQSPVANLPGTPGCFNRQSVDVGARRTWASTQNDAAPRGSAAYELGDSNGRPVALPAAHPGAMHTTSEGGRPSYLAEPGYPTYASPWGYSGASRTRPEALMPSGHDDPIKAYERRSAHGHGAAKGFLVAAVAVLAVRMIARGR